IFEAAAYANVVFVAQEQVPSEPLNDFLPRERRERYREGLYPNPALAQALHQAASGLQAVHAAGLVHGHLSAACLRRGPDGRVCLTGLGEEPVESRRAVSLPEAVADDPI